MKGLCMKGVGGYKTGEYIRRRIGWGIWDGEEMRDLEGTWDCLPACRGWGYRQRPVVILLPWRRGVSDE